MNVKVSVLFNVSVLVSGKRYTRVDGASAQVVIAVMVQGYKPVWTSLNDFDVFC
jgi:hypothetical protein